MLPGIDPFNLFLSNLSSTRFCNFPSSDGIFPVNPLEWKFTMLTLLKPPNSEGIGPVSRLTLKSRTLRFFSEPISFGIVPKSRLWSKYSSCKKLSRPSSGAMNPLRDEFDSFRRRPWQMLPSIAGTAPRSARQGGLGGGSAPSPPPPQHSASSWPSLSGGTELAPNPQLSNYQPWLDRGGRANSRSHGAALVLGCPGTHRRFQRGHVWRWSGDRGGRWLGSEWEQLE